MKFTRTLQKKTIVQNAKYFFRLFLLFITRSYSSISPLILPFGVLAFVLSFIAASYNIVFVLKQDVEGMSVRSGFISFRFVSRRLVSGSWLAFFSDIQYSYFSLSRFFSSFLALRWKKTNCRRWQDVASTVSSHVLCSAIVPVDTHWSFLY